MRLIDADALVEVLGDPHLMLILSRTKAEETGEWGVLLRRMDVLRRVLSAPTIDAAPVVHARWKRCFEDWRQQIEGDECSACGFKHYGTSIDYYHYCPNCGAKMRGETDEE